MSQAAKKPTHGRRSTCINTVKVRPLVDSVVEQFAGWVKERKDYVDQTKTLDEHLVWITEHNTVDWFSMNLKKTDCHNVLVLHTDLTTGYHSVRFYEHVAECDTDEAHYELMDVTYHQKLVEAIRQYITKWNERAEFVKE